MKEVYNHQEIGTLIDQGQPVAFTRQLEVRVTALVQLRDGARLDLDQLDAHCRPRLAAYKLPRHLVIVERAQRSPSGKPDYEWAHRMATAGKAAG